MGGARDTCERRASRNRDHAVTFGDFGMQIPSVFTVISIVDDIRLEIELVAREAAN